MPDEKSNNVVSNNQSGGITAQSVSVSGNNSNFSKTTNKSRSKLEILSWVAGIFIAVITIAEIIDIKI